MVSVQVFSGQIAAQEMVHEVVSPAYDAMSSEQRRAHRVAHPSSYLHVTRSAPDEDDAATVSVESLVARGRSALDRIRLAGAFDDAAIDTFVVYELETGTHRQRGIVCEVPAESFRDAALPHEATRPERSELLARHFVAVGAASSPVACAVADDAALQHAIDASTVGTPHLVCDTGDGLIQRLWKVTNADHAEAIISALDAKRLYIVDGHHRAAANSTLLDQGIALPVLTTIFPAGALQLVGFHRLVRLPPGLSETEFLDRVRRRFRVTESVLEPGQQPNQVVIRARGLWHVVHLDERPAYGSVTVREGSLAPSVVEREIVGGSAGRDHDGVDVVYVPDTQPAAEVAATAAADQRIAILVPPVTMDDVVEVAEGSATMPAKTTFFTPKVRSGLFLRSYEAELARASDTH